MARPDDRPRLYTAYIERIAEFASSAILVGYLAGFCQQTVKHCALRPDGGFAVIARRAAAASIRVRL